MRKGNRTVMTMQNTYQGPPENFAMVVPVPVVLKKEDVKTLPADVFDKVDSLSAPRLVEYWEQDPCQPPLPTPMRRVGAASRRWRAPGRAEKKKKELGVTVEAQFVAGEYEVVILSATESQRARDLAAPGEVQHPAGGGGGAGPVRARQVEVLRRQGRHQEGKRDAQGVVQLSPLRFAFDANELRLPVRLGLLNAAGKQDLLVYVIHPTSRFEVANYANAFIPTNLEVADGVRNNYGAFFAELFDATVEKMGRKVVVTEYAWQTTGCDPCPTPPLTDEDLTTLGLDIIEGKTRAPPPDEPAAARRPQGWTPPSSWVLTRLHARYDKESLSEDLVFREAKPAMGGRANWNGTNGDEGANVAADGVNNFQGRYIIRHYWTGRSRASSRVTTTGAGRPAIRSAARRRPPPRSWRPRRAARSCSRTEVRSPVPLLGIPGKPPQRRKAAP